MDPVEYQKQLMVLSTEVEEYAMKLIQDRGFSVPQVAFILATVGSSLLAIRANDAAAIKLLRSVADDIERGVAPTLVQ